MRLSDKLDLLQRICDCYPGGSGDASMPVVPGLLQLVVDTLPEKSFGTLTAHRSLTLGQQA